MGKFWGPRRLVEVWREPNQALGIAIVGGKVDMRGGRHVVVSARKRTRAPEVGGRAGVGDFAEERPCSCSQE